MIGMDAMASLNNKKIVLGISGGIAAYKSAELARALIQEGAEVQVVMTDAAQQFITPITMQALTGKPVFTKTISLSSKANTIRLRFAFCNFRHL